MGKFDFDKMIIYSYIYALMQPIIEVYNIGKKFRIYHKDAPYLSLRDSIVSFVKKPLHHLQNSTEEFWALKDVSFQVMPGESVGIIGRNGAGKSTLLKILSRITPPTTGRIVLRGRVASLLEVGTGFHPELTGRENVFFNGAILGMKRSEIKRKFDEIVDFAGVEKFIDTPLKHYSSGMQLRLAFAVAAFLEAEILVVDEVLAVGDAEFQKKCLGKMEDVTKKEGRTVLFVSHNMGAVMSLCNKGILLERGEVKKTSSVLDIVQEYTYHIERNLNYEFIINKYSDKNLLKVNKIIICDINDNSKQGFFIGEKYKIKIFFQANENIKGLTLAIGFRNETGISLRTVWSSPIDFDKGDYEFEFIEREIYYGRGIYNLALGLSINSNPILYIEDAAYLLFSEHSILKFVKNIQAAAYIVNTMDYNYKLIKNIE